MVTHPWSSPDWIIATYYTWGYPWKPSGSSIGPECNSMGSYGYNLQCPLQCYSVSCIDSQVACRCNSKCHFSLKILHGKRPSYLRHYLFPVFNKLQERRHTPDLRSYQKILIAAVKLNLCRNSCEL